LIFKRYHPKHRHFQGLEGCFAGVKDRWKREDRAGLAKLDSGISGVVLYTNDSMKGEQQS
jgi:hypothetical protein